MTHNNTKVLINIVGIIGVLFQNLCFMTIITKYTGSADYFIILEYFITGMLIGDMLLCDSKLYDEHELKASHICLHILAIIFVFCLRKPFRDTILTIYALLNFVIFSFDTLCICVESIFRELYIIK